MNEAIIEAIYKDGHHWEFRTYAQWRREGFIVKAGEKPFLLWGNPKDIEQPTASKEAPKYFPLIYMFSNAQVEPVGEQEEKPEPVLKLELLPYR